MRRSRTTRAKPVSYTHLPFLRQGKDVLYLGFSSGLSGTYHNGAMAAEELQEEFPEAKVITVDTLCASMGQGLLVDLAVQEKRKGKDIEAVRDFVRETIPHLCHWFTVGDLSQLRRGGRLSAGKAIVCLLYTSRCASSRIASWACFLVPTNSRLWPFSES